ncbi:helix-turn-helix domain-containing protein [Sphaerisporangium perillae]|uniref:helix-turn-helix domain-containing protein n=1 Tax=Sphaerisporangium perillae TaxID=2935860 RepID=UPI00200E2569|nr:helix-turn-helix transcriptional regulator [Sphaerisporangium perillae]
MGEARRCAGRPELARARRRLGMSQEEAAEAVGVATTTWARWERGEQGVRACYRARIATAFGVEPVRVEEWIEGWAFGATSSWPAADSAGEALVATVKAAAHLWRLEMDPSRRHLLAALPFVPSALAEWLVSWNYGSPAASAAHEGPGRAVGLADVARINEARKAFSQMDQRFGAGLVRPVVLRYLNENVSPLLRGRYDDRVGAELMSAAAGMSWMAGWTAFDVNQHGQAQQHFGQALQLAKAGNDPMTGVWVLATLTRQAIHLEQHTWAVWLARAAVDTARKVEAPPRVLATILVKEAWATALEARPADTADRHSAIQVERLVAEAERAYARGTTDRDPEWTSRFEEAELSAETGNCWRLLGEHRRAAECAETAVTAFGDRVPRSVQFNRIHAAEAYLEMGELEQALASARSAIPLTKTLTSARPVDLIRRFTGRLEPYADSVMVREFRDHLNAELAA